MTLRRQIVHFVRVDVMDKAHEIRTVAEIAIMEEELHAIDMRILIEVIDAPRVERARTADNAVDFIALAEQQFRKVAAVLSRNAGDERFLVE